MPIAYPTINQKPEVFLSREEEISLYYHSIFEYPLTAMELIKWSAGKKARSNSPQATSIKNKNGLFFVGESEGVILKRLMRKRISARKIEIAKRVAKIISFIPTVKVVAITGALAMENATDESDIDLMIIAKKGTLWTTRAFTYLLIGLFGIKTRRPKEKTQRDKLCLNMWLDESDLVWFPKKRNIYTAHEIAQLRPLVNRDQTYEELIAKNGWIKEYWPNAVKIQNLKFKVRSSPKLFIFNFSFLTHAFEKLAFKLQYSYMRKKITREIVTVTRALFHPVDWGKYVLQKLEG